MKKLFRILALVLALAAMVGILSGCGKTLSGTYKTAALAGSYTSLKFAGSKVTIESYLLGSLASTEKGKYSIEDEKITFTMEAADSVWNDTFSFVQEKDSDSVTIGMFTYTKQ